MLKNNKYIKELITRYHNMTWSYIMVKYWKLVC